MPSTEKKPIWMVSRQAFGGPYWRTISFGPFATKEEAEEFTNNRFGGHVFDANKEPHLAR